MSRLDLNAVTAGYRTSPRERIAAHLADDLRRQFPHIEDVDFYRLAHDLVAELVSIAGGYRLEDYGLPVLKRDPATTVQLEQLADHN